LANYDIHFAFDSDSLDMAANSSIANVASQIKNHNPSEVIVTGHTDTAGPKDYNEKLSMRRANTVSGALTQMGVKNRVIKKRHSAKTT